MSAETTNRTRPVGETTGSPQRPAQRLLGPALTFDLAREARQMRAEDAWRQGSHNAKTLVGEPNLRVLLIAIKPGARLERHHAPGQISVQTLDGHLRLHLPDQAVDLPAGHLLALEPGIEHDVEAVDESLFLLTIGYPSAARSHG